jgi:Mce-associated membrane protein
MTTSASPSPVSTHTRRVTIILWVLLCAAATMCGIQSFRADRAARSEHAGQAAIAAAALEVPTVLSYNVAKLDADLARGQTVTTGPFATQYAQLVASTIRPVARSKQVVTSATVVANSVISATPDKVVLLTFVDQQSSNVYQPTPRLDTSRLQITMTKSDGRWLISGLTPV